MRHLHFTQSVEPLNGGGLGASAVALHLQMIVDGIPSTLCTTHGGVPQRLGAGIVEFRRWKPDALYFSPEMLSRASRLVDDSDVVHGHGLYVGPNFIFGRAASKRSKSLVYHVQGMFEPYILARSQWKKRLVHALFEDANIRRLSLWRALTEKEAGQIRQLGHRAPIVVAPNGLDLDRYPEGSASPDPICTPLVPALNKARKRLLFLGRLHPKKGLTLLIPALVRLSRQWSGWELVIAGPDELGHLGELRSLVSSAGLEASIVFTGTVTGQPKLELLRSADLFVLPSLSEGLPVALLEAMACKVPVVATMECNCPDVFEVGAGWPCTADIDSLTKALDAALSASDSERAQRGAKGRRLVATSYNWSSIVKIITEACRQHC